MAARIEEGSVVRLKSGGKRMTVSEAWVEEGGTELARCIWMADDDTMQEHVVPVATLELSP